jgi:hypothetical protein
MTQFGSNISIQMTRESSVPSMQKFNPTLIMSKKYNYSVDYFELRAQPEFTEPPLPSITISGSTTVGSLLTLTSDPKVINAEANLKFVNNVLYATGNIEANAFYSSSFFIAIDDVENFNQMASYGQSLYKDSIVRMNFTPIVISSAFAIAYMFDTHNAFTHTGAKLISVKNHGVEKFYIDKDGEVYANGVHLGDNSSREPALGNPGVDGYILSSTAAGVRSWIALPSSMVYPGAGIAISTGSAWGTSITDNSVNWNSAYGWGNHAGLYSLLAHDHSGVYSLIGHDHAGVYSLVGHDHSGIYEPVLGNPGTNGFLLSSTTLGVRSWVATPSHSHGNITNAGKIGTTAYLPVLTGTGGILNTGVFGTYPGTFCAGDDARLGDVRVPSPHNLVDTTNHPVTGLTAGHVMKALSATTYGFAALTAANISAEPDLGDPLVDGYILASTVAGARSWVVNPGDGHLQHSDDETATSILALGIDELDFALIKSFMI